MAQKIQDRLLAEFEQLAERAGLFLYTVEAAAEWLIVDESDGIDTRLIVQHNFERVGVKFKLAGQAVDRPDREFWAERKLYPQAGRRNRPVVEFYAEYADGERLGTLRQLVTDLLAPYAAQLAKLDAQLSGQAEVVEVTRSTAKADGAAAQFVLTVPAARSGPDARKRRVLDPMGYTQAVSMAGSCLGNMAVARELVDAAREEGWARAEVGGAYSKLLPAEGSQS